MKDIDTIQRRRHLKNENKRREFNKHLNMLLTDAFNKIRRDYGLMLLYPVPDKLIHGTGNSPTKSHKRR